MNILMSGVWCLNTISLYYLMKRHALPIHRMPTNVKGNDVRFCTLKRIKMDIQVIWHEDSYEYDKHFEIDGDWSLMYRRFGLLVGVIRYKHWKPRFCQQITKTLLTFWFSTCSLFDARVVLIWCSGKEKEFIFKFNLTKTLDSRCIAIIESNHI